MQKPMDTDDLVKYLEGTVMWACDMCGHIIYQHACKIRCSNCGFTRDCSDP